MKGLSVFLLIALSFVIAGCGEKGGSASGKWVGEVYASEKTKSSTVIGEFDSYEECLEASKKEAKSGIFNCGIK